MIEMHLYGRASADTINETGKYVNADLSETLDYFSISPESFKMLVSAVFDCRALNRKIIILTDLRDDEYEYKSSSLLYHIFRFLPYQIREFVRFGNHHPEDICFISREEMKKVSSSDYKIGDKSCMYDYILDSGNIIHTKNDKHSEFFDSHGILFENLSRIIAVETETGECQNDKLTGIFELLDNFFKSDDEKLYSELSLYDTVFIIDSILRDKRVGRVYGEKLISDFIKFKENLSSDTNKKWCEAIKKYFASFESDRSDSQIIEWLTKLHFLTSELAEYSLDTLTRKMCDDIKSNGTDEISRYTDEIISHGIPDAQELLDKLCKNNSEIALAYISYYFDGHPTTEAVINSAPIFYRDFSGTIPDCEKTLYKVFVRRFKDFKVTSRDAVVLSSSLINENAPFIDEFYTKALDYVFANIKFEKEDPKWFGNLRYSDRMNLSSEYSYLVYALKYILSCYKKSEDMQMDNEISFTDTHISFAGAYIKREKADEFIPKFHDFDPRLRDMIYEMYTDFRITLSSYDYRLLYEVSYTDAEYDYSKLCMILSQHPEHIADYILFIPEVIDEPESLSELLSALEKTLKDTSDCCECEHTMDIIRSAKLLRENERYQNSDGASSDCIEKFISEMFDRYISVQNPIKKAALTAAKKAILS